MWKNPFENARFNVADEADLAPQFGDETIIGVDRGPDDTTVEVVMTKRLNGTIVIHSMHNYKQTIDADREGK